MSTTPTASRPPIWLDRLGTPVGEVVVGIVDEHVALLEFIDRAGFDRQVATLADRLRRPTADRAHPLHETVAAQLTEYFNGRRREFDIPIVMAGTPFQEQVWQALLNIPWGQTRSYAEVARSIGRPRAVRAVGRTNGLNRVAILVPCHRVIGADGQLTGYGGGLWRKQRLLDLEGA